MDNQVGHVANQISSQSKVKEHVENVENHLPYVFRMIIPITHSGKCGDWPIYWCYVANPQALGMKIWHGIANPRFLWVRVPISKEIVEACCTVHGKKCDLQDKM